MRDLRTVRTTAPGLFVVSILLVMSGSGECGKGLFQMTVRDAQTHLAVGADVRFEGPENRTERANAEGRAMPCLGPGEYQIEVSAPGY